MLFTSYGFIGFAAVLLLLYYTAAKKWQGPLLLLASYLFYFISGPAGLLYILTTTISTYWTARVMGRDMERQSAYLKEHTDELSREEKKTYRESRKKVRLRWMVACLVLNLGILVVVKYANFLIHNVNGALSVFGQDRQLSFLSIAQPLGISFYTFQAISYLVDVYRGTVPAQRSLPRLALFISYFPQLVQGPINRYGDLSQTLWGEHRFDAGRVSRGLQRVLWGYFKKMVVADRILAAVTTIIGAPDKYNGAYAFVGMVFYTVQLYADFTGGIDVTIGLSEALGITMRENFDRPYFSKSLKEYWRRWHISMCSWFRDYVFYPVSTSKAMQGLAKRFGKKMGRRLAVYLSTITVWLATGIWHGANWNFVVWGLANCVILMVSEELEPLYSRFHERFPVKENKGFQLFQMGRTFLLVCCLNLFDCFVDVGDTLRMLASICTVRNWHILWDGSLLQLGLTGLDYVILLLGVAAMLGVSLGQGSGSVRDKLAKRSYPVRFAVWYGLFLIVLLMGAYGVGYDASQFIYNQF